MKEENCWNVFKTSGDPLAYLIYSKVKNKKTDKKDEKNRYM
ncbi:MAG: hypothetical protein R3Y12_08145 [Clostridia bacterium]